MRIEINTEIDDAATLNTLGQLLMAITARALAPAAPNPHNHQPAPDFSKAESLPADNFEKGTRVADVAAESVFAGAAPLPAAPPANIPLAPLAPLPPAPPPLPAAPVGAMIPPPPGALPEVDSAGVPYDARIHNDGKTKKQDGTWKHRKKLDPAILAAVMAEIAPVPTGTPAPIPPLVLTLPAPPPIPPAPVIPPSVSVAPALAPEPIPVPASAPFVASTDATGAITFRDLMAKMNAAKATGKFTEADAEAGLKQLQLRHDEFSKLVMPVAAEQRKWFSAYIDSKGVA